MIIKGNRHSHGAKLAAYLLDGGRHGERVAAPELHGFGLHPDDISKSFGSLDAIANGKGIENPLFHIQIRLPEGEQMTREQWDKTTARILKTAGLQGQPYARVFHTDEKTGEIHCHLGVSLIDEQTHHAKAVPFYKFRFKALARKLEVEFDLTRVTNERDSPITYAATKNEERQALRLGVDKEAIRTTIRACHDRTDCGREFDNELANEGLILALGNRRDYVVIDHAGGIHALGQRILGMKPRDLRVKLADLDHANIPTIEQAREFMLDLPRDRVDKIERELAKVQERLAAEREYARRDPVREEIQWQEALDKAAIAKEEKQRQFVEPKASANEKPAAERNRTQPGGREEKVWPINPPQHQSWPGFEKAASEATRDDRTENLKGPAAKVWEAFTHSDREAEFAKVVGNRASRFREGEILIVTEPPLEYRRDEQTFIPSRVHKLDPSLAYKLSKGLDIKLQGLDATLKLSDDRAQQRSGAREAVRLDRATDIRDFSRSIPGNPKDAVRVSAKITTNALGGIGAGLGKGAEFVGEAISSLFAPKLSPEQIREGEITQQRREADAEASLDYSRFTAERTQQRRQEENDSEAERQRQRDEEHGRER